MSIRIWPCIYLVYIRLYLTGQRWYKGKGSASIYEPKKENKLSICNLIVNNPLLWLRNIIKKLQLDDALWLFLGIYNKLALKKNNLMGH